MSWALLLNLYFRRPLEGNQGMQETFTRSAENYNSAQTALRLFNDVFNGCTVTVFL